MKQYVLALLIASFLAISSLGVGISVITNGSQILEDDDTCYYDITVFKYYDVEETGKYNEEIDWPIEDWYFELFGKGYSNGDERDHPPWYYLANGTTNSEGYLVFEDWQCGSPPGPMGHYKVREYIPDGWYNVGGADYPTPEQPESNPIPVLHTDNEINIEKLENDDNYVEISFWLQWPMTVEFGNRMKDGEITVYKYYEMDESGLEGWTFHLWTLVDGEKDEYIGNGTTDENGEFTFENVYPGNYIVEEELQDDWYNVTALHQEVTVYPDQTSEVWFFNAMQDGSITVYKFYDIEMTGEFDGEIDEMLEGWTFHLWTSVDGGKDEYIGNGTTDENGEFTFENVYPGYYIVEEEIQYGWENTTDLEQLVSVYPNQDTEVWFGNAEEDIFGNITVYKFYDANYDGEYDDEEELIDGFMFQLWAADEDGNPIEEIGEPVNTTDGTYTFEELEPGYYIVQEIIPEVGEDECCWVPTTEVLQHVEVKAEGMYSLWFGNVHGGRIEGMKFLDVEADGNFDVGLDKPLMGWEINLWTVEDGEPGEMIDTTETDRSGQYYFDCLVPGEYFVQEEMYEGWYNVTPAIQYVYVEPCETEVVDFANCMYKDIYGIKFYDYNRTGEFDEEDWVIEGWEINLWNEIDGEPGVILQTVYTQPNGYYFFEGLKVGTYYVQEEVPYGWDNTTPSLVRIELNCCTPCRVVNFGNYEFPEITINKFYDVNMTGEYNPEDGDYLLVDEPVEFGVYGEFEGVQVFAETFGVNGTYNFPVPVGDFNVTEYLPAGWLNTTDLMQEMSLGPGDHWIVWFGNVQYGDIEVYKFYDENMNGTWDEGEEMLEGWTFELYDVDADEIIDTTTTNEHGMATFENVLPGEYAVEEIEQDGWFSTTDVIQYVEVEAGGSYSLWFGNVEYGNITVCKFYDENMNGTWDEGEEMLEGWTFNLYTYGEGIPGQRRPLDVVMMLDTSGSMSGTRMSNAKAAAIEFMENLDDDDRMALYTFDGAGNPYLRQEYLYMTSANKATIGSVINGLSASGYTPLWDSIGESITYSQDNQRDGDVIEIVLAMTDGDDYGTWGAEAGSYIYAPGSELGTSYETHTWGHSDGLRWGDEPLQFKDQDGPGRDVYTYNYGWANLPDAGEHRTGLIHAPIPVYTVGLGIWPVEDDPENPVLGDDYYFTSEYQLWRIAETSGARYFYTIDSEDLELIFADIFGEVVGGKQLIATGETGPCGCYTFEDLVPGEYMIEEELQNCWFNTTPSEQFVTVEGGNTTEVWFGNVPGGFIEGYKFCDYNLNQEFDDIECGLEGWEIQLHPINGNGEMRTTMTDEYGYYNFTCIEPGMYRIEEVIQDGWYNSTSWYYEIEVLPEGELWIDFGNYRYGDITGLKFCDFNMNGEFDGCLDWPMCGWEIQLWDADVEGNMIGDDPIEVTYTDNWGMYRFEDLGPGDYVVKEVLGSCGWINTTDIEVHVRMGCVDEVEVNFGNYRQSDISVKAYDYEMNEPVVGLELYLWEADEYGNPIGDDFIAEGVTGDHGYYIFCKYDPGYYVIQTEDEQLFPVTLRCCTAYVIIEYYDYNNDTPRNATGLATYAKFE